MFRVEHNIATGEETQIAQKAYRNSAGDTLVLDADEKAPEGFTQFDPAAEEQES